MNRKSFLKRLGIGAAAVIVAPKILEAKPEGQSVTYPQPSREVKEKINEKYLHAVMQRYETKYQLSDHRFRPSEEDIKRQKNYSRAYRLIEDGEYVWRIQHWRYSSMQWVNS